MKECGLLNGAGTRLDDRILKVHIYQLEGDYIPKAYQYYERVCNLYEMEF